MSQKDWEGIKQIIVTELILQHNKHTKLVSVLLYRVSKHDRPAWMQVINRMYRHHIMLKYAFFCFPTAWQADITAISLIKSTDSNRDIRFFFIYQLRNRFRTINETYSNIQKPDNEQLWPSGDILTHRFPTVLCSPPQGLRCQCGLASVSSLKTSRW